MNLFKETGVFFNLIEAENHKQIYISEDALQERPQLTYNNNNNNDDSNMFNLTAEIEREDYEETSRLFNNNSPASGSYVSSSFISDYTEFSGFETDQDSVIIPPLGQICVADENSTNSEESTVFDTFTNVDSSFTNVTNIDSSLTNVTNIDSSLTNVTNIDSSFTNVTNIDSSLTNVTNIDSTLTNVTNIDSSKRMPVVKATNNKENVFCFPQPTPVKTYKNNRTAEISPDLFADEDEAVTNVVEPSVILKRTSTVNEEQTALRGDQKLFKNVQMGLSGVLPPPSVTTLDLSVTDMLNKIKTNGDYFWTTNRNDSDMDISMESKSLLVTGNYECCVDNPFPEILRHRFHGLHHNRSKLSEEFELLCDKYSQRHVGSETQSSCTIFELNGGSPSKRKNNKQRWSTKSPGRRLSHLARRRITFSSSNISSASSSFVGSRTRQILVDAKKLELLNRQKSPKKTPKKSMSKSPVKTRTPSSTAKKKLAMRFRMLTGEIEDSLPSVKSVKTHIFEESRSNSPSCLKPITNNTPSEVKRNLFSSISSNVTLSSLSPTKKRKHCGGDDCRPSKLPKVVSFQGRCSESNKPSSLNRTRSEPLATSLAQLREMTDSQKKKLQWVVYETLKSQNITSTHANFKTFASTLARVIRRILPCPLNIVGSVSGAMLKIARNHIYAVVKGKTVDEIVNEYAHSRASLQKNKLISSNKENVYRPVNRIIAENSENVLGFKNDSNNSVNVSRIRKVINFGEDNR